MTDRRGRAARWQTALLLVPGAAALFSGTVSWAAGTVPTPPPPPAPAPTPTSPALDKAYVARIEAYRHRLELQTTKADKHARVLRRELSVLRARTAALRRAGSVAPMPVAPVVRSGGGGAPVVVVAPPPPVVAVAPPPPAHTTTGASGRP